MTSKRSKSFDAASFFDRHAAVYAGSVDAHNVRLFEGDRIFFECIKKNPLDKTFLDVGAGPGHFASSVKLNFPDMHVTALDPSINLLSMIEDRSIRKVVGKIPDLNLDQGERFSFIAVLNVLHHLAGKTINESRNIVKESLFALRARLDNSGLLMIREEMWETYIVPTASRALAFFLLSVASRSNVAVPRFLMPNSSQRLFGLVVCMYTASELENMLNDCGFEIVQFKTYPYPTSTRINLLFKKFTFLKRWGQMQFIVKKANTGLAQ